LRKFQKDFLSAQSSSDKFYHHGYQRIYPWFLNNLKNENVNVLEIGIDKTESLKFWKGYFKNVNLHGIDIDPNDFHDKSVKIYRVDQSKEKELENFIEEVGVKFDIILDDGSHVPMHQITTIEKLWRALEPSGVYIIEDIETSYWGKSKIYGYKFNSNKYNILGDFESLIDVINSEFSKKKSPNNHLNNIANEVEMVTFAYNSIILVKKDYDNFSSFYDRDYRFEELKNYRTIYKRLQRIVKKIRKYLNNKFRS